jgi:hypothetical protein
MQRVGRRPSCKRGLAHPSSHLSSTWSSGLPVPILGRYGEGAVRTPPENGTIRAHEFARPAEQPNRSPWAASFVPGSLDDQRLSLRHGPSPNLNGYSRELRAPCVDRRLACPMPAQDLAAGRAHDLVNGACACHQFSVPWEFPLGRPHHFDTYLAPDKVPQAFITAAVEPLPMSAGRRSRRAAGGSHRRGAAPRTLARIRPP